MYNETAFLLSDQNDYVIKVIKFDGTIKAYMHSKKDFTNQCILKSIEELITYVNIYNTRNVDLKKGKRIETPLFNEEAFREVIVIAFVHNDWSMHLPPAVYLYDDRLEVVSYGKLPFLLNIEDFYEGKSMPVNEALFKIFLITHFSEQSGHGIPIVVKVYGKETFNIASGMIEVEFKYYYDGIDKSTTQTTKINDEEIDLLGTKEQIIRLIKENSKITLEGMAKKLNLTRDDVKYHITKLQKSNVIKHEGKDNKGYWKIIDDIKNNIRKGSVLK